MIGSMTALVTGRIGLTRTAIARRLVRHGHHVVALDNPTGLAWEAVAASISTAGIVSGRPKPFVARGTQRVEFVHHWNARREVHLSERLCRYVSPGLEAASRR